MLPDTARNTIPILDCHVDAVTWEQILDRIEQWSISGESRYVCLCNVHSIVTAKQSVMFRSAINEADAVTCDGMPLAWYVRRHGYADQKRISGPDLMWRYCHQAATRSIPIFLYGATPLTLEKLSLRLRQAHPGLIIAGSYAPPFRELTPQEEQEVRERIHSSGAKTVFVGLGCPKQELWMQRQRGELRAVMLGVGAAFDYHAGVVKRAPSWMQNNGLEWFYRLCAEPKRLWRRYLVTNSLFIYYLLARGREAKKA
jgi:N-acetylglucosaminyldiphosphoundecaprenol N-acetyl-beta-D-mannosaminyltransferase